MGDQDASREVGVGPHPEPWPRGDHYDPDLLANGDILSVVLFGGMGVWAVAEIVLINRREGAWIKPEPVPISAEIRPILIGVVVFVAFFAAHPYLFGVSPMGDGAAR